MDDLNTQYFQMTPKIHISVVHSSGSKQQRRTIYFILHTYKDTPGWGPQLGGSSRMYRYNAENQWERQAGKRRDYCAFFKGGKDGYSPCPTQLRRMSPSRVGPKINRRARCKDPRILESRMGHS